MKLSGPFEQLKQQIKFRGTHSAPQFQNHICQYLTYSVNTKLVKYTKFAQIYPEMFGISSVCDVVDVVR